MSLFAQPHNNSKTPKSIKVVACAALACTIKKTSARDHRRLLIGYKLPFFRRRGQHGCKQRRVEVFDNPRPRRFGKVYVNLGNNRFVEQWVTPLAYNQLPEGAVNICVHNAIDLRKDHLEALCIYCGKEFHNKLRLVEHPWRGCVAGPYIPG